MVGYTRPEIKAAFGPHLEALATKEGLSNRKELWGKIAAWYNSYSWGGTKPIFNLWSIGHLLKYQQFDSYWPTLRTPSWLLKLLVSAGLQDLTEELGWYCNVAKLNKLEIDMLGCSSWDNISLLFHAGFLSIADWKQGPDGSRICLDFPNNEVKDSIARDLFGPVTTPAAFDKMQQLKQALDDNNVQRFYGVLDTGLHGVPFTTFKKHAAITDPEAHYSTMISMLLTFVLPKGYVVHTEDTTSDGQIDLVIETPSRIFLCEHKILPKGTAERGKKQARMKKLSQEALEQIKRKGLTLMVAHLSQIGD